jgi:hypothetical protein
MSTLAGTRVSVFSLDRAFFNDVALSAFIDDAEHEHSLHTKDDSPLISPASSTDALLLRSSSESLDGAGAGVVTVDANATSTCRTCAVRFDTTALYRAHCATEWHRLNLKLKLAGVNAVAEVEFNRLRGSGNALDDDVDDEDDEESGDADRSSGSDDDDDKPESAADAIVAGLTANSGNNDDNESTTGNNAKARSLFVAFVTADRKRITVNKSLLRFSHLDPIELAVQRFRSLRTEPLRVAVLLISGGKFAGGLFVDAKCTHHRALSRYVVRAKQGGSQAFHDSKGRAAKSAGASLRRHNAVRMHEEIADTMREWRADLDRCHLILLSAPGDNRRLFVRPANPAKDDAAPFARTDARIRSIAPLAVQRPTFAEVQRVHQSICSIDFDDNDSVAGESVAAPAARATAVAAPKSATPRPHPLLSAVRSHSVLAVQALFADSSDEPEPYLAGESDAVRRRWEREALETPPLYVAQMQLRKDPTSAPDLAVFGELVALASRGRIAIDAPIGAVRFRTPLHIAMLNGNLEQTLALLRAGADPSRRDSRRALPIDVAAKAIVDTVRRFAFENADLCAWTDGGIVPLSPDGERTEQAEREQAAVERAKVKAAAEEKAAAAAEERRAAEVVAAAADEARERAIRERRAIVKRVRAAQEAISDREKRAIAAERRIKGTPKCTRCDKPLPVVSFDWDKLSFCSERCFVEAHQQASGFK